MHWARVLAWYFIKPRLRSSADPEGGRSESLRCAALGSPQSWHSVLGNYNKPSCQASQSRFSLNLFRNTVQKPLSESEAHESQLYLWRVIFEVYQI